MKNRFLFFDIRRSKIISVLIVFQVGLWLFYVASLMSLLNFNSSYRNRFDKSFPNKDAKVMVFYKMVKSTYSDEESEKQKNTVLKAINYLEKNNYVYGILQRENSKYIPAEKLGVKYDSLKPNFNRGQEMYNQIYPIGMNYGMITNYRNRLSESITKDLWKVKNNNIPVILGSSFEEHNKLGDSFEYEGKKYFIAGFFKEDTLAYDYTNIVDSSFSLNDAFVIPLEKEQYLNNFNMQPVTIYSNLDKDEKKEANLVKDIKNISTDIVIKNFSEDINVFLEELKNQRIFETMRILIISIIATGSIVVTISYKIISDKDRIGILYSVGISKVKIFEIISSEFFTYIILGLIGGSLFYMKNCKDVYAFFINENLLTNLYIGIGVLIFIVGLVLMAAFNKVSKLSPKEMVGGFKE